MTTAHELAYILDPASWVRGVLGVEPSVWQSEFLRAHQGASIAVLTARQVGKTTAGAWAIAHFMVFNPGSMNVVVCPAVRQSAEAVRRVKECLLKAGCKLKTDNIYSIELDNGSRVLALPGSDDSIRGLTVDGWIIADEAARLSHEIIAAVRPMRARRPEARFAMLSTAWSRTDPFWEVWSKDDPSWLRLKATADIVDLYDKAYLEQERLALGEIAFNREYMGIPGGSGVSPFGWELYDRATRVHLPLVPNGARFGCRPYNAGDVKTWPLYKPIIAHDVAFSRDRSTAVIGGSNPYAAQQLGIVAAHELPQNLFGSDRANALAAIDRQYNHDSLIVADLSNDASYGEILVQTFGSRVIGVHITARADGMEAQRRFTKFGSLLVYTIGRTILLEQLHREFHCDLVRLADGPDIRRGFEQLANLELEYLESGTAYRCRSGQHDDLGISFAILAWAAQHPHLSRWMGDIEAKHRPRRRTPPEKRFGWAAFL